MSGKISIYLKEGTSGDKRYGSYLYWGFKGEDHFGRQFEFAPRYEEVVKIMEEYLLHELYNDLTRERKPDFPIKLQMFMKCLKDLEHGGSKIKKEDVPEEYHRVNIMMKDKDYYIHEKDIELCRKSRRKDN